ncbi:CD99 antigen-like isoform X3 [Ambystoma mexicanum]|uniref:CD99 antigen-like isoform X3 n=1 Tax=Ambystoma mexicanum TaxID=8296 RepID=UPI0037E7F1D1
MPATQEGGAGRSRVRHVLPLWLFENSSPLQIGSLPCLSELTLSRRRRASARIFLSVCCGYHIWFTMLAVRSALLLLCLTCALTQIQGQDDFDLAGALDDDPTPPPTKKPVPPLKPDSGADADFDLGDAIGGAGPVTKKPVPQPNPGAGGDAGGGSFSDDDLLAGVDPNKPHKPSHPSGRASEPSGDEGQSNNANVDAQPTSVIAGIVGAVGAALIGAVSSYIAYQKKKLCFKNSGGDGENVNMEQHAGDKSEPQVQRTLLER